MMNQLMFFHWGFVARILKMPGFTLARDAVKGFRRSRGNR